MKKGILYGVGVGPGDPELITVKALKIIQNSDILIFPGKSEKDCRAFDIVKGYLENNKYCDIIFWPFPMIMDKDELVHYHDNVCLAIRKYLDEGKNIAFMTIGDPTIYSTFSYIYNIITSEGYETVIINGISSINAVAARLGICLADSDEMIHIIPGSAKLEDTLELSGTRVYMKSGKQLKRLLELLKEQCMFNESIKVMAVSNCGTSSEMVYTDINEIPIDGPYIMTIIVIEKY